MGRFGRTFVFLASLVGGLFVSGATYASTCATTVSTDCFGALSCSYFCAQNGYSLCVPDQLRFTQATSTCCDTQHTCTDMASCLFAAKALCCVPNCTTACSCG